MTEKGYMLLLLIFIRVSFMYNNIYNWYKKTWKYMYMTILYRIIRDFRKNNA